MYNKQTIPTDNNLKYDSSDYNCRVKNNIIADFYPIHSPDGRDFICRIKCDLHAL